MDPVEAEILERRSELVERLVNWGGIDGAPMDALLDAIPFSPSATNCGWVVIWAPHNKNRYRARWSEWSMGAWVSMLMAKRDRSLACFMISLEALEDFPLNRDPNVR